MFLEKLRKASQISRFSLSQQSTQPELSTLSIVKFGNLEISSVQKVTCAAQTTPPSQKEDAGTDVSGLITPGLEIGTMAMEEFSKSAEDRLIIIESMLAGMVKPALEIPRKFVSEIPRQKKSLEMGGVVIVQGSLLKRRRM